MENSSSFQAKSDCECENEIDQCYREKSTNGELYDPFSGYYDYFDVTPDPNNTYRKEYEKVRQKFVNYKPTRELLDDLEKLAQKGFDQAAIDIGHYAMEHVSEFERAKKLLKNAQDSYATHLLGVFASYEDDEETALALFLKALEMGVPTSYQCIVRTIEGKPDLRNGKYAHQIEKALLEFKHFRCCC